VSMSAAPKGSAPSCVDPLGTIPVPVFGGALGLIGLSLLLQGEPTMEAIRPWALVLLAAGVIALIGAAASHVARAVWRREALLGDLANPSVAPFFGQAGIALLLLSEAWHAPWHEGARLAFASGAVSSLIVGAWSLARSRRSGFARRTVTPAWLIAPIAWLYVALLAPRLRHWIHLACLCRRGCAGLCRGHRDAAAATRSAAASRGATRGGAHAGAGRAAADVVVLQHPQWQRLAVTLSALSAVALAAGCIGFVAVGIHRPFAVSWWAFGMPLTALAMSLRVASDAAVVDWAGASSAATWACLAITALLTLCSLRATVRHFLVPSVPVAVR
jgi:tellurite resistance protein TehA-like permease